MRNIELHCVRLGIKRMLLASEDGSKPFYEALSFVPSEAYPEFLIKEVNPLQKKVFHSGMRQVPRGNQVVIAAC